MKSLMLFWAELLKELGSQCNVRTDRDLKTASVRFEHEGVSFLTLTLPAFAVELQKALAAEACDRNLFPGFARQAELPKFLGGFLDHVFDRESGRLLDSPDVDCIFALRQLTMAFGKIELPCSDARNARAIEGYLECEQAVRQIDKSFDESDYSDFRRVSLLLFSDALDSVQLQMQHGQLVPRHGPGRTADRLDGNAKYDQREWTERLEYIAPYGDYVIPNWRFYYRLEEVDFLEPGAERPVRVTLVPKTLKAPRIIAVEPTAMQWVQQSVAGPLVRALEHGRVRSLMGFTDQVPNQHMAVRGSARGDLATLDLSEASDRVSNQHVRQLLSSHKLLRELVEACRSRKADVPGHGVIRLAKFASMGSALCFPIEAMVFLAIVFLGIERAQRRQLTRRDVKSYSGRVRVYGDDIIVPVDCVPHVIDCLHAFGLKVNVNKSFASGKFRESCGVDAYDGVDVTPVRVRQCFPSGRGDVRAVVGTSALRNLLNAKGLFRTARWLDEQVMIPILGGHYPYVEPTSAAIGRTSFLPIPQGVGWDDDLHRPMVKAWRSHSEPPPSRCSGEGALMKFLVKDGGLPSADPKHLERYGRPKSAALRLGWQHQD